MSIPILEFGLFLGLFVLKHCGLKTKITESFAKELQILRLKMLISEFYGSSSSIMIWKKMKHILPK